MNHSSDIIRKFNSNMKAPTIAFGFCLLFRSTVEYQSRSELVENFINNSNNSISIISIGDAFDESCFDEKAFVKSFVKFRFVSETLKRCEKFAKVDKYSNVTMSIQLNKFRSSQSFENFVEIWNCVSCDYIIFSPSQMLASALKCFVSSGRFLLLLTDSKTIFTDGDLMDMLNRTWTENGALKVFLSINANVYSFNPFHRNSDGIYGKLNSLSDVNIAGENITNLNGYRMNVEMFAGTFTSSKVKNPKNVDDFTGPDASTAKFISERLNATSKLRICVMFCNNLFAALISVSLVVNDGMKFGFRTPNGTLTGALRTIQFRTCDIAFIGYFIKDYETRDVEFSSPVYSDELCIVVKKAGRIPQFILPLIVFDGTLWLFLGLETILGNFIWLNILFLDLFGTTST